jgi:hypothetical protein
LPNLTGFWRCFTDEPRLDPKPDDIAVAQLVHLHADLGGKLLACQAQADRLASDMRHVEAVIRMFDPAYDVRQIAVKRRQSRNPWFKRGHMFRAAIDVLREARAPLETREIAVRLLVGQRIAEPTLAQIRNMTRGATADAGEARGKDRGAGWRRNARPVAAYAIGGGKSGLRPVPLQTGH